MFDCSIHVEVLYPKRILVSHQYHHTPLKEEDPSVSSSTQPSTSSPNKSSSKSRRKPRILGTEVVVPTDDDVLFGRGPTINKHPGNRRFREKALEFLSWYEYENSCKERKKRTANLLVESVKSQGHRFLEKGGDKLWYEVIQGEHHKASQVFRDLKKPCLDSSDIAEVFSSFRE